MGVGILRAIEMAINLQKGQRISLSKAKSSLSQLMCGLGWDVAQPKGRGFLGVFQNTPAYDLDSSVICVDAKGQLGNRNNLVYYGNLRHPSGAIVHLGDNLTGEGDGDDEQIFIDLPRIPSEIVRLAIVVNIYRCRQRQQDFGQIRNAFVRLVDRVTGQELARYHLSGQDYQGMTGMILAEIYRHAGEWQLLAVGKGIHVESLEDIVSAIGEQSSL